jgi:hypothetical protein
MARWVVTLVGLVIFSIATVFEIDVNHSLILSIVINGISTIGTVLLFIGLALIGYKQKTSLSKAVTILALIACTIVIIQFFAIAFQIITLSHSSLQ